MLQWISQHEGFIRTILTSVYFVATLAMVWATLRSVRLAGDTLSEMKAAHAEETRPDCILDVAFDGHDMDVYVKNLGRTAACNLKLTLEPDHVIRAGWTGGDHGPDNPWRISDLAMVAHPIEMLAPGERYSEHLDVSYRFFNNNEDRALRGRLEYEDEAGAKYRFDVALDLAPYAERSFVVEDDVEQLIGSLDRLKRHFSMKR